METFAFPWKMVLTLGQRVSFYLIVEECCFPQLYSEKVKKPQQVIGKGMECPPSFCSLSATAKFLSLSPLFLFFHVLLKCTSQILLSSQNIFPLPKTCASAVLTFLPTSSEWSQVICGHFCLVSFMSHVMVLGLSMCICPCFCVF